MEKIPTLFERQFENHRIVGISDKMPERLAEFVKEHPDFYHATIKWDGSCCAVRFVGQTEEPCLYKRYDAKKGKQIPEEAIPCCKPDEVTGHQPCWMPCHRDNPADKWFWAAYDNWQTAFKQFCVERRNIEDIEDKWYREHTYHIYETRVRLGIGEYPAQTVEAVGPHFQGNPYGLENDILIPHGVDYVDVNMSFEEIKNFLKDNYVEGLVFWNAFNPAYKIKRTDFGLEWNGKGERKNDN